MDIEDFDREARSWYAVAAPRRACAAVVWNPGWPIGAAAVG